MDQWQVTKENGTHIYQDKNRSRKTGYADFGAKFGLVEEREGMLKVKGIWDVESGRYMDGWVEKSSCGPLTDTPPEPIDPIEVDPVDLAFPTRLEFQAYRKVVAFLRWLNL